MEIKNKLLITLTACFLATVANATVINDQTGGLDEFVKQAMAASGTPGLAISIVHGDEVIIARGYGVREAGKNEPVDKNTLFAIGSNSKYFTATALGLLVDEGQLSWDEPLTRYLPELRFSVPYLFTELTLRDALSHRTGLQRGDLGWYANPGLSRDEVLAMIEKLPLEQSFRSGFLYNNFMFLAAGQAIPAVTGMSWDEFLDKRVFEPLQMKRTNTSTHDLDQVDNVATPHTMVNGKAIPIPYFNIDHIAPAGSINSSVSDMAQWCRVQLGGGQFGDRQVIPKSVVDEVRKPHNLVPLSEKGYVRTIHGAYALGIGRANYGPEQVAYFHTGGIDGMLSSFTFVPGSQLCVVVLTNSTTNYGLNNAVLSWVLDHELGLDDKDYVAAFNEKLQKQKAEEAEIVSQHADSHDPSKGYSLSPGAYAGIYSNDIFGDFVIDYINEELRFSYGSVFHGKLTHHKYDSFDLEHDRVTRNTSEPATLSFGLNAIGEVESVLLEIRGEESQEMRFVAKQDEAN